eukprot:511508_1
MEEIAIHLHYQRQLITNNIHLVFIKINIKKQQKAKRITMIKNYSDAELLKILNKKRSNRRNETRKNFKHSKNKKNKRRTSSLGVGRRAKKKRNGNKFKMDNTLSYSVSQTDIQNNFHKSKQKRNEDKLKQLEKYYSLKLNHNNNNNNNNNDIIRSKKK